MINKIINEHNRKLLSEEIKKNLIDLLHLNYKIVLKLLTGSYMLFFLIVARIVLKRVLVKYLVLSIYYE